MITEYEQLTDQAVVTLEGSEINARAYAGMMIVQGIRKDILTQEEGLRQLNNLLISIIATEEDRETVVATLKKLVGG